MEVARRALGHVFHETATMSYPGTDGFLGTRASLMLDLVFSAMFLVLPVMAWSIYQVRVRRRYGLHKVVQLTLGVVLGAVVLLFEVDMRRYGWTVRAAGGPDRAIPWPATLALWCHLPFAVSTAVLWVVVIVQALRKFPRPPRPGPHSVRHVFWARLAAADMLLTAVTGWIFYWAAFVR